MVVEVVEVARWWRCRAILDLQSACFPSSMLYLLYLLYLPLFIESVVEATVVEVRVVEVALVVVPLQVKTN